MSLVLNNRAQSYMFIYICDANSGIIDLTQIHILLHPLSLLENILQKKLLSQFAHEFFVLCFSSYLTGQCIFVIDGGRSALQKLAKSCVLTKKFPH